MQLIVQLRILSDCNHLFQHVATIASCRIHPVFVLKFTYLFLQSIRREPLAVFLFVRSA